MKKLNKVVITGQSGIRKGEYINNAVRFFPKDSVKVFDFGESMYDEARKSGAKIKNGKILSLPLPELNTIRRSVFKDLIEQCERERETTFLINTHSCFRWARGLFHAFDFDLLHTLDPTMYITLIDDVDAIDLRLRTGPDPPEVDFSLKDIMVWREEEIITTQMVALSQGKPHYVLPRLNPIDTIFKLVSKPHLKKTYVSFPITGVRDQPKIIKRINKFRNLMAARTIVFDPYTIQEKRLLVAAHEDRKKKEVELETCGKKWKRRRADILAIQKDIDGQIISRDFKLIDQSDMIVAFIPEVDGKPEIAAGVQSEIQYGHDITREVFVIWPSDKEPSVWVKEMASKVFSGENAFDETIEFLNKKGYLSKS